MTKHQGSYFSLNIQNMYNIHWNRRWMYDRCYSGLKESFVVGVEEFVSKASQQDCYDNDGGSYVLVLNAIALGF